MNGYVLAGGRSTRMGRDKALLLWNGHPLIAHAVDLLRSAGVEPHIAGSRPDLGAFSPIIYDLHPGCGPLSGIEAALARCAEDAALFIPVDLPLLPYEFLREMIERAAITGAVATIPTLLGEAAAAVRGLSPGNAGGRMPSARHGRLQSNADSDAG